MDKNKKYVQRNANKIIKVLFKISEAVNYTRDLNELFKAIHKTLGEIIEVISLNKGLSLFQRYLFVLGKIVEMPFNKGTQFSVRIKII